MDASIRCVVAVFVTAAIPLAAGAFPIIKNLPHPKQLEEINAKLAGHICDFTRNHDADRRIYSPALCAKRDLYVYTPPGYDGVKQYPVVIWMHGLLQDERGGLSLIKKIDEAIVCGTWPPMIFAVPDGTFKGKPKFNNGGSFYLNGVRGHFEDYLMTDVWNFLFCHFAIRPEREAHVLAGASMGGLSAFNLAFKYREKVGVIVGIMPLLDLMYADGHGNHFGKFDPDCLGRIDHYRRLASAGHVSFVRIRNGKVMRPLFGSASEVERRLQIENPVEMLDLYDVKPGEFQMFIAWTEEDNFSGNNECKSFLHHACQRGITADTAIEEHGQHNSTTAMKFFDRFAAWLKPRLDPYVPKN
jgi:S-formylglutathione hydrolase FrmB